MVSITGTMLQFDKFVVNTFILLREPTFVAIGVDDFGFIVVDLLTTTVVEEVPFRSFFPSVTEYSILKLINIADNGVRIFFKNGNSFSFIWDNLRRVGDMSIFENARITTKFLDVSGDYSSNLIKEVSGVGVAQLIYFTETNGFRSAFVRFYNYFNRVNSKVYQEFSLGFVES